MLTIDDERRAIVPLKRITLLLQVCRPASMAAHERWLLVLEDQMALLSLTTHTVLAGFVGGTANVAQTVVGPILSPLVEVSGAAATAIVAAHAVTQIVDERAEPRRNERAGWAA